jgi:predicted nucleic acid-binding Zn ribbon protein
MKKRNNTARIVFIVISVLILLSMILGFVMMVIPPAY